MADAKSAGVEASAISLLKEAVSLDRERRFTEALVCYREGIQLLMGVLKATTDPAKKTRFTEKITEYMERAEALKTCIEKENIEAKVHEEINIEENATGYSYEKVFAKCFGPLLSAVEVQDPYIRSHHQVTNFLRFCELVVKLGKSVREIKLITTEDRGDMKMQQAAKLEDLKSSLLHHNVHLYVQYSDTLHDREVRFNNGWNVKLGRGLDYFKAPPSKFSIGSQDYDLRPCYKTTINIFHSKFTRERTE